MPNIRPLWTPDLGVFHIYIHDDGDYKLADELKEKHYVMTGYRDPNDPNSRLFTGDSFKVKNIVRDLIEHNREWHIDYEELGDDLDKHCAATFNQHTFTTADTLNDFCNKYYDAASKEHTKLWWQENIGEITMPVENDGSFLQENCYYCMNSDIVRVDHNIKDGIESYTPIYGCKYKGKKCKPKEYPPEDK